MKRSLLFTVTALAAIACNKSELTTQNPNTSFEGTPMSITVEMPSSQDTKVQIDQTDYTGTWITKWTEGDNLTAFHYSGSTVSLNTTSFQLSKVLTDGKSATFEGSYDKSQDGMVLMYAGTNPENLLSGQAGLSLTNQTIVLSTTDKDEVVTATPEGALGEYSYMISDQIAIADIDNEYDYNSVSVKHLTALMELNLTIENLPDNQTYSVVGVDLGVSNEYYEEFKEAYYAGEFGELITDLPEFATLYTEESYDITKPFSDDEFATHNSAVRGVYSLDISGCEVSQTNNSFTIPFNAFPFTVKSGEYFAVMVYLEQHNSNGILTYNTTIDITLDNSTGGDLEFDRGKHHTITHTYTCNDEDFEYIWDGSTFTSVDEAKEVMGEADEEDVYQIGSAIQLVAMSYLVNHDNSNYGSASYSLASSISLNSNEWTPIGTTSNAFKGSFDGNNLTISSLSISSESTYRGLFGYVEGATIENFTLDGTVTGNCYIAGIAGRAEGTTINNCHNQASVTGVESGGYNANDMGGVVGLSNSSTIINCSNTGAITSSSWGEYIGGVVGLLNSSSSIVNSYNTGAVKGYSDVGGIVGYSNSSVITNCYNTGIIKGTSYHNYGVIIGYLFNENVVANCYWLSGADGYGYCIDSNYDGVTKMEDEEMQDFDFVTTLDNGAYTYNQTSTTVSAYAWFQSTSLYPVQNYNNKNPTYTSL